MWHLIFGLLLFAVSLLAVLEPPNNFAWMVSVLAKEFGWVLALLSLLLLWPGWIHEWTGIAGAVASIAAAACFVIPLSKAWPAARRLPTELEAAFGPVVPMSTDRPAPFVWRDLFLGVRRPRVPVETVTYAVHSGIDLKMDVYRMPPAACAGPSCPAANPGPAPAVLVIHGGAWRSGNRKQLPALNHYLAARGYVVAAINYRLSPAFRFPDALADVRAALTYLKEHAAERGVDAGRIVLLGRSAGAHLAAVAGCTAHDPAVRGVIGYYGPYDLAWGYRQTCKVLDHVTVMQDFLGGDPDTVPELYREATVVNLVGPDAPPILMLQGEADTMVSPLHAAHLIERLKAHGRKYHLVLVPLATHASDVNFGSPFGQMATYSVERFLRAILS